MMAGVTLHYTACLLTFAPPCLAYRPQVFRRFALPPLQRGVGGILRPRWRISAWGIQRPYWKISARGIQRPHRRISAWGIQRPHRRISARGILRPALRQTGSPEILRPTLCHLYNTSGNIFWIVAYILVKYPYNSKPKNTHLPVSFDILFLCFG